MQINSFFRLKSTEKTIKNKVNTDRQTDRPTDRQTDRPTDRETDKPTDRHKISTPAYPIPRKYILNCEGYILLHQPPTLPFKKGQND